MQFYRCNFFRYCNCNSTSYEFTKASLDGAAKYRIRAHFAKPCSTPRLNHPNEGLMPPNYPGSTSTTYDSNSQLTSTTTDSEMLHMLDFEFDSSGNGGNGNTAKCHTGNSYTVSTTLGNFHLKLVLPDFKLFLTSFCFQEINIPKMLSD